MTIITIGAATPTSLFTVPAESTPAISPGAIGPQGVIGATGPQGISGLAVPGGRVTLSSSAAVMNANVTAANVIYYSPYVHDFVPIYNGSVIILYDFNQTSVQLDTANVASGNLYDLFIWNNGGTPTLGYGPAWTSLTIRSAAITQTTGIWSNSLAITLRMSSSSTQNVAANQATYVGTFYATANGQTGMNFLPSAVTGGNNSILGLFNAFNRVPMMVTSRDSAVSWTYASSTWRVAHNNANNAVNYVDGLGEVFPNATLVCACGPNSASAANANIGINLNSTTATPNLQASAFLPSNASSVTSTVNGMFLPVMGFNTLTAMENTSGVTCIFFGTGAGTGATNTQGLSAWMSI